MGCTARGSGQSYHYFFVIAVVFRHPLASKVVVHVLTAPPPSVVERGRCSDGRFYLAVSRSRLCL